MGRAPLDSHRIPWVAFVVPGTIFFVVLFGRYFPDWLHPGYVMAASVVTLLAWVVRTRKRGHEDAGLVPRKRGYSAKVDHLAVKLRERADAVEAAVASGAEFDPLPEALVEFLNEVRKTARDVDHRPLLADLKIENEAVNRVQRALEEAADLLEEEEGDEVEDERDRDAGEDEEGTAEGRILARDRARELDGQEATRYVARLRAAADEASRYAEDVRSRGGVYKIEGGRLVGCFALLLACAAGGGLLAWRHRGAGNGPFWVGLALLGLAAAGVYVFQKMQGEDA